MYEILTVSGETIAVDNPSKLPEIGLIEQMREPIVRANILVPQDYLGNVITLCVENLKSIIISLYRVVCSN